MRGDAARGDRRSTGRSGCAQRRSCTTMMTIGCSSPRSWRVMRLALAEANQSSGRPRLLTSARLRQAWSAYECAGERMTQLRLFGWDTPVNPETVDAWRLFERVLLAAGYQPHRAWVYNCRQIAG